MNQRIESLHREEHRAILAARESGLVLGFIAKDRVRRRRPLTVFNSLAEAANTLSSPNTTDSPAPLNRWEEMKPRKDPQEQSVSRVNGRKRLIGPSARRRRRQRQQTATALLLYLCLVRI